MRSCQPTGPSPLARPVLARFQPGCHPHSRLSLGLSGQAGPGLRASRHLTAGRCSSSRPS
eukprot:scaffold10013_cov63-Phaeocystis_antarctica.AAC.2